MKIRKGFVSNSSSSSFVILGIKNTDPFCESIKHTIEYEPEADSDYGEDEIGDLIAIHPDYEEILPTNDDEESRYKLSGALYIGLPLRESDLENKTLAQIRQELIEYIKKEFNVELRDSDFALEYGEYDT